LIRYVRLRPPDLPPGFAFLAAHSPLTQMNSALSAQAEGDLRQNIIYNDTTNNNNNNDNIIIIIIA
jgi:hypothetical protein